MRFFPVRMDWRFLGVAVFSALALTGCERAPIDYKLDGTWAWETLMNCADNENTIVFNGSRIQVFRYGESVVTIDNVKYQQKSHQNHPLIIVRYGLKVPDLESGKIETKDYREEYLAVDDNVMVSAETKVDGVRQIPYPGGGRALVRCPVMPAP